MARGIERRHIFRSARDRRDCLDRLARAVNDSGASLYAWCLMPNHVHVLVRTGAVPLGRFMQRWIGAYAADFNRRHARVGHLFQNRYKSIVVEDDPYLLQLVRYVHRNPLRAGLVANVDDLDRYPWTGHAVLLGARTFSAQDGEFVLRCFGDTPGGAREAYREFARASPPTADGSGEGVSLRCDPLGWRRRAAPARGRERWGRDERVLGSPGFVDRLVERESVGRAALDDPAGKIRSLVKQIADRVGVGVAEVASPSLRKPVVAARSIVCFLAVRRLGLTLATVARALRISPQSVRRGVERAPDPLPRILGLDEWVR